MTLYTVYTGITTSSHEIAWAQPPALDPKKFIGLQKYGLTVSPKTGFMRLIRFMITFQAKRAVSRH